MRFSETGCAVPSEFANSDTRSSSSISTTETQASGTDTISCDHSAWASVGNRLPIFLATPSLLVVTLSISCLSRIGESCIPPMRTTSACTQRGNSRSICGVIAATASALIREARQACTSARLDRIANDDAFVTSLSSSVAALSAFIRCGSSDEQLSGSGAWPSVSCRLISSDVAPHQGYACYRLDDVVSTIQ